MENGKKATKKKKQVGLFLRKHLAMIDMTKSSPSKTATATTTISSIQQQQSNIPSHHQLPPTQQKRTIQKSSLAKQMQIHPNPSLVRRARVIRRQTTNIYCDTLKKLREEDAVLINQILIIKLKPRSQATNYECSCVDKSDLIPSVDFAYPPMGSNATRYPPQFFYPDFMRATVQRKEEREAFQVILTNDKAERTFAFCFKFLLSSDQLNRSSTLLSKDSGIDTLYNSRNALYAVLVFVSPYPHENLYHELATDFVNTLQKDSSKLVQMCNDLLQLRLTTSEKSVKLSKYVLCNAINDNRRNLHQQNHYWTRTHVSTVLEAVGIENALLVYLSLLAERRVIITGSNVTEVSRTVQAFVRLLSPLEWPHTLIPIVPDSQIEFCFNPTPYICGLLRYNLSRISELICPQQHHACKDYALNDGITIMDVERGMIVPPLSRPDKRIGLKAILQHTGTMGFPRAAVCDVLSAFKSCLPVRDPERTDYKIEKQVMIWYAKLFGHYRIFGYDILTARNRKLFARAHPCPETRLFLKWFVENGILQSFIFTQSRSDQKNGTNSNAVALCGTDGICLRFHKILKKYAPPVDKKGHRRRTKSILWKVFTL